MLLLCLCLESANRIDAAALVYKLAEGDRLLSSVCLCVYERVFVLIVLPVEEWERLDEENREGEGGSPFVGIELRQDKTRLSFPFLLDANKHSQGKKGTFGPGETQAKTKTTHQTLPRYRYTSSGGGIPGEKKKRRRSRGMDAKIARLRPGSVGATREPGEKEGTGMGRDGCHHVHTLSVWFWRLHLLYLV